uniref:Uncharacterized protein n=1 Tax=Rhizophora mucronata TaxID=61149 RepID=A0A2P2M5T8_RHIMU
MTCFADFLYHKFFGRCYDIPLWDLNSTLAMLSIKWILFKGGGDGGQTKER